MKKRFLLFALALLTAVPSWCDLVLIDEEDEERWNDYYDPTTRVIYSYYPGSLTAEVRRGQETACDDHESEVIWTAGSLHAEGDIYILSKFTFDGCEYTVTKIADIAFYDLKKLTSVFIPNSVTSIGSYAFAGCSSLAKVYSMIEEPFEINNSFRRLAPSATLYVPIGTKAKYEATGGWNVFENIEEIDYFQLHTLQQDYHPLIVDGKKWSVHNGLEMSDANDFFLGAYTQIDHALWRNVLVNHGEDIFIDDYAAVREEGRKVYAINAGSTTPHLVYDIDMNVGDVVNLVRSNNGSYRWIEKADEPSTSTEEGTVVGTMELTSIDIARTLGNGWKQEAGVPFRRFTFTTTWTDTSVKPNTVIWVEGVGCDAGPFMPWHNTEEMKTMGEGDYYSVSCEINKNTVFWGEEFYVAGETIDTPTAIHPVHKQASSNAIGTLFDLQGRKFTQKPQKGIYILNGRKRVVK